MKQWRHRLQARWVRPAARRRPPLLKAMAEAPTGLLHDPVLLAETVNLEFAVFALDALPLWLAFRALSDSPAIWIAHVCFIMASMAAATLGPIPLGLGTSEAACVGMLSLLDVAIETALAATLLLRGLVGELSEGRRPAGREWCWCFLGPAYPSHDRQGLRALVDVAQHQELA
jgi:uncharacterized membrane protein YbhN (UPF0104 family)